VVGGYAAFFPDDPLLPDVGRAAFAVGAVIFGIHKVTSWIEESLRLSRHGQRLRQLEIFASHLARGTTDGRGFYSGGVTKVAGQLDGRDIEVVIRVGPRSWVGVEVRVPEGKLELESARPSVLAWLLGSGAQTVVFKGIRTPELDQAVAKLVLELGFARLSAGQGRVWAEKPFRESDLRPERLLELARAVARVARLAEDGRSTRKLSASGSSEQRCPWCHGALEPDARTTPCPRCATIHHESCFLEAGGCTVFACSGRPRRSRTSGRVDPKKREAGAGTGSYARS
jgi:hypothetical protein